MLGWKVYSLNERLNSLLAGNPGVLFAEDCTESSFDYLAIGNSITIHGTCDYWWNEIGMAASEEEKDYVHLLSDGLQEKVGAVNCSTVNLAMWETLATDRAEMLAFIEAYLNDELDLVTIQLGENAKELETFAGDFKYLIQYIQKNAANAKIIVIGDFWKYENRDEIKQSVAEECGVMYVSLREIINDPTYQCGIGTVVKDPDGNAHIVEHSGVARHPGDAGMQYIADKVMEAFLQKEISSCV